MIHAADLDPGARRARLVAALDHSAEVLPAQGPIGIFVHHNTLHAYERLPFEYAVEEAARRYGAEPYWSLEAYRAAHASGRIADPDLDFELRRELGDHAAELLARNLTRLSAARHLLLASANEPSRAALEWALAEGIEPLALWSAAVRVTGRVAAPPTSHVALAKGGDTSAWLEPLLIRLCAAFVDQGVAYWRLPDRELGFFAACARLLSQRYGSPEPWMRALRRTFEQLAGCEPTDVALRCLDDLAVREADWVDYLSDRLLALPGWAGLFRQLELRPDRAPVAAPPARLMDFVALRLVLEREGRRAGLPAVEPDDALGPSSAALAVLCVARSAGWSADDLDALTETEARALTELTSTFDPIAQRRLWQRAYERTHRTAVLDDLAAHPPTPATAPRFQLVFCIDEREESLRRLLEELAPECETFGAPGFFGVAMYYRGIDDAHARPLCPIAIKPQHEVEEVALPGRSMRVQKRAERRKAFGRLAAGAQVGSRTFVRGTLWSSALGVFSAAPLVARVLFPRATAALRERVNAMTLQRVETRLDLSRRHHDKTPDGRWRGFSVDEMTEIVERQLSDIGLTSGFTSLVAIIGHGSHSLNNPHESAHDCGACGGGHGAANARALAQMANRPDVRAALHDRGILIPAATWFVGGFHDSCDDGIELFDTDLVPAALSEELDELRARLDDARALDARERCRRFGLPAELSPQAALRHVEARAEDLAQPRPEYGHATNAVCVVGRRARTRGLFLDRRAFLMSYDPTTDAEGRILERVLASVVPVGAGINLEYYFSFVDQKKYGAGTKLPHNITGLVGVMDGHASDLRTGLPWQMVEIHEPVRLLAVIEAPPARVLSAAQATPDVWRLVRNGWLQVATLDPASSEIRVLDRGQFVVHTRAASE